MDLVYNFRMYTVEEPTLFESYMNTIQWICQLLVQEEGNRKSSLFKIPVCPNRERTLKKRLFIIPELKGKLTLLQMQDC